MTDVQLERLAELLGCDPDFGTIAAAITTRQRERDRMRKQIGDLRALVARLQRIKAADQIQEAHDLLHAVFLDEVSIGQTADVKKSAGLMLVALCWVLGCPAGVLLQRTIDGFEAALRAHGYEKQVTTRPMTSDEFNSRN